MLLPYLNENLIEAGCDEAGRGCLAEQYTLLRLFFRKVLRMNC